MASKEDRGASGHEIDEGGFVKETGRPYAIDVGAADVDHNIGLFKGKNRTMEVGWQTERGVECLAAGTLKSERRDAVRVLPAAWKRPFENFLPEHSLTKGRVRGRQQLGVTQVLLYGSIQGGRSDDRKPRMGQPTAYPLNNAEEHRLVTDVSRTDRGQDYEMWCEMPFRFLLIGHTVGLGSGSVSGERECVVEPRRRISALRWKLGRTRRTISTLQRSRRQGSDKDYWATLDNHDPEWSPRSEKLASLIAPGQHVIEFGAGRRHLESMLPIGCEYTPSDIVERGPETIVIDLNDRPLPPLSDGPTIAVFAGVFEYIHDVEEVLSWLSTNSITKVIASYEAATTASYAERVRRAGSGWVNTHTPESLRAVFESAGYPTIVEDSWDWGDGQELILIAERGAQ